MAHAPTSRTAHRKPPKDIGERLVDFGALAFFVGAALLLFAGLMPLLGDGVSSAMRYQESARELGLSPLFGDHASPELEVREGAPMILLRIGYALALLGGGASVLLGFCLFRPASSITRLDAAGLEVATRGAIPIALIRRSARVPGSAITAWEEAYADRRSLGSLSKRALLEVGVDAVSGLLAAMMEGSRFEPTAEDERRLQQSLTIFLAEMKMRGIALDELTRRRGEQIRKEVRRMSEPRPRRLAQPAPRRQAA